MSTLLGHWKGEDNLVDSVNGNDAILDGDNPPGLEYIDGIDDGKAFKLDYNSVLRIPYTEKLNFGINSKFSIECYYEYIIDETGFRIAKGTHYHPNYVDSFEIEHYDDDYEGSTDGIRILSVYNDEYSHFDDSSCISGWNKIKCSYDNGYWKVYINDLEVACLDTNYNPIQNTESPIYCGLYFAGGK
jgi:hypothetical protein